VLLRDPGIERDGFGIGRQDDPPGASFHQPPLPSSLRKDTRSIVLRRETTTPPYNDSSSPFWFPPRRALEADAPVYAAWLLYASGLSRDTREAADRSASIERALEPALEPAQRQQLRGLLASIDGVGDMSAEREDGSRAR
jgi:hypothetical protein